MKKFMIAFVSVVALTVVMSLVDFSSANAAVRVIEGYGDGHCTQCGLYNGHYRCAAFVPTNNHSSVCCCGHGKSSHAYR